MEGLELREREPVAVGGGREPVRVGLGGDPVGEGVRDDGVAVLVSLPVAVELREGVEVCVAVGGEALGLFDWEWVWVCVGVGCAVPVALGVGLVVGEGEDTV